jgi:drug/metabolite transporter (DMT)-like permease
MKFLVQLLKKPVLLFVVLLILDVSVLVLEKFGATAAGTAVGDEFGFTLRLAQTPWVWGVAVLSLLQLFVWTRILSKTELSVAYPISSLFFPLAMLCSVFLFREHVSWVAWTGGILITLGIACFSLDRDSVSKDAEPVLAPVLIPIPVERELAALKR